MDKFPFIEQLLAVHSSQFTVHSCRIRYADVFK